MDKLVYLFHEGHGDMKELLGGKGANLAEMTRIGLLSLMDLRLLHRLAMLTMKLAKQFLL